MRYFLLILLAVTCTAQTKPAQDTMLSGIDELEKKCVGLAEAMPQEKYGWRPDAKARSFGAAAQHLAYSNYLLLAFTGEKEPSRSSVEQKIEHHAKLEESVTEKTEIVKALQSSFRAVRESYKNHEGNLNRTVMFAGKPVAVRDVYVSIVTHASEHLGQMIAYARMNGVTPPWSKE
jgi:uncharacterized damage-inducible protein DinB